MRLVKNKFLGKLIVLVCLFLTLLNCITTNKVYAAEDESKAYGGELLSPFIRLVTAIGDGIMEVMQKAMVDAESSLIRIKSTNKDNASKQFWIVVLAVLAVVAVAATVALGGWGVASLLALAGKSVGTAFVIKLSLIGIVASTTSGIAVAKVCKNNWLPKDLYLPVYKVTPGEIFSNKLAIFDVNFFNPNNYVAIERRIEKVKKEDMFTLSNEKYKELWLTTSDLTPIIDVNDDIILKLVDDIKEYHTQNPTECPYEIGNYWKFEIDRRALNNDSRNNVVYSAIWLWNEGDNIQDECYTILSRSDSETVYVFYGQHARNDVYANFGIEFGTSTWTTVEEYEAVWKKMIQDEKITEHEVAVQSTAQQLKGVISKWYFTLRNIALLILMLVLIYVGIRIVIGSTAGEKAKYKERLIDWLVALCLVIVMHYIMVFAVEIVERITELVIDTTGGDITIREIEIGDKKDAVNNYDYNGYKLSNYVVVEDRCGVFSLAYRYNGGYENRCTTCQRRNTKIYWILNMLFSINLLYSVFLIYIYEENSIHGVLNYFRAIGCNDLSNR